MTDNARSKRSRSKPDLGLLDGLVQLSFAVHGALERVAEQHELSLVQVRLLGILRDREPGMLELAKYLGLDKSSVTGLVTRAERRGFVQRSGTAEDRRAVHVALTAQGRELAQIFAKEMERELAGLVSGLSEADQKRLSALASAIVIGESERRMPGVSVFPRKP